MNVVHRDTTSSTKIVHGKSPLEVHSEKKEEGFFEKYKPVICFEPNAEKAMLDKLASEIDEDLFNELKSLENPGKNENHKAWGNEQFWGRSPDWDNDTITVGSFGGGTTVTGFSTTSGASGFNKNMNLRRFLKHTERTSVVNKVEVTIAELFPEATIMFADISGFTAWSSMREADQVFYLLEQVFQSFDEAAKRHKVFKVETVGDCYVGVCGLPKQNKDHAVIMARFARECVDRFNDVVTSLEKSLGPDTSDLAIRIGLNSGPVTAGVLRGERPRLQLFGDTVNTAARIETSGLRNRIHCSEHTAEYIKEAGLDSWLTPREDIVSLKGKGKVSTFWLHHQALRVSSNTKVGRVENSEEFDEAAMERRIQRSIDWSTDLLLELLKNVVAHRNATRGFHLAKQEDKDKLKELAVSLGDEKELVVDEVANVIELPEFDFRGAFAEPESVILPPDVVSQCREYVALIASMYNPNPFHNFEHATHVTMSVHKILSRIVHPKLANDNDDNDEEENDIEDELMEEEVEELKHDHTYGITSDPLTQFAIVLSALVHDADHRGVPNGVLAKVDKALSEAYHNKTIAEQNSVDIIWEALCMDEFDALRDCICGVYEAEMRRFRQLLVNAVIATDIFDKEQSTLRKNRWAKAFSISDEKATQEDINRKATIVIEHVIQASDVAHTMQHWHVYQKWNERLFHETCKSYLAGITDKDPSEGWYKGELWFFDNYVIPLAKKLDTCGVFGVSSDEYLNYAQKNRMEWYDKGEAIVEQFKAKYLPQEKETKEGEQEKTE